VCTSINGRKRLLVAKLDFLYKHVDWKKAKTNTLEMVEGTIYNYPKFMHKKNEALCAICFHNGVVYQLGFGGDWGEF